MAGSGPAGLEVQNDHLRIQKGSQVPSWGASPPCSHPRVCTAPTHALTSCIQTIALCTCALSLTPTQAQWERAASPAASTEQDGFGSQAVASRMSESALSGPARPGEPGRAEPGISKGRWCPLLSQKNIGAAESTSGTCHPGRGAGHPPLWAAGVGTELSLAAPREQPGLTAIRAQWV